MIAGYKIGYFDEGLFLEPTKKPREPRKGRVLINSQKLKSIVCSKLQKGERIKDLSFKIFRNKETISRIIFDEFTSECKYQKLKNAIGMDFKDEA